MSLYPPTNFEHQKKKIFVLPLASKDNPPGRILGIARLASLWVPTHSVGRVRPISDQGQSGKQESRIKKLVQIVYRDFGMGGNKRGREEKNTKMVRNPSDPNKHTPVRRANFRASACAVPALSLLLSTSMDTSMCFTGALVAQGPHGGRGLDRFQREGRGATTHPQYGQSGPKIAMQLRPSPDPVRSGEKE
jgi:hypothetical protein